uniref:hypothetical protein n=1 Tax=Castellaniella defragrans TaxID=75697 RepID=UPI0033426160
MFISPFEAYILILGSAYWPLTLVGTILFARRGYVATSTTWRVIFFAVAAILAFPLVWFRLVWEAS